MPAGLTVTFSPTSWTPGASAFGFVNVLVVGSQQLIEGAVSSFVIRGKSSSVEHTLSVTYIVLERTPIEIIRFSTYVELNVPKTVTPLSSFNLEGKLMLGGYQTPIGGKELLITTSWNGKTVKVKTDVNGWFSYALTAPEAGVYSIKAEFNGDDEYAPSEKTMGVIVAPPSTSGCLIATATYGSELSPEVQFLREFRDQKVMRTLAGREFMTAFNAWYYSFSPTISKPVAHHPLIQAIARMLLYPLIGILHLTAATYSVFNFNPELAVLMAGLVASSLIGVIYFSPFVMVALALLRRRNKLALAICFRWFAAAFMASLTLIAAGEILSLPNLLLLGTIAFVLATLSLSALTVGTRIFQILKH